MSTNEAHSDGILYENLNKEVPDSNDYEQLRETDTILDSKMYVFFTCIQRMHIKTNTIC